MQLEPYLESLNADLRRATALADEQTRQTAERLAAALDAPLRLMLTTLLADAAAELTAELPGTLVELGMNGRDPVLRTQTLPAETSTPSTELDGDGITRITLRLPDGLKSRAEAAAEADGDSLNTWITNACRSALLPAPGMQSNRGKRRITGWA